MEDWEQFFVEKSRRRFEKQRDETRRERIKLAVATLLVVLAVGAAITVLSLIS